ncbi:hypothetical protein ACOMHN_004306 [Nucella lapillus]
MATRVTFVSGTAEVKRRVEEMMVSSSSAMTGDRGNPYYGRSLALYSCYLPLQPCIDALCLCSPVLMLFASAALY